MKKLLILYDEYIPTIDAIKMQLSDTEIITLKEFPQNKDEYDLILALGGFNLVSCDETNILVSHKSLLPAFNTDDPVRDAIIEGVKVTGITIYFSNTKKIIAQYPLFILNEWHYDDLKLELNFLEQSLLPIIVEKILNHEIIDLKQILKPTSGCSSCSGGNCSDSCGSCSGGCHG